MPSPGRNNPWLVTIIGTRRVARATNALPIFHSPVRGRWFLVGQGDGVLQGGYARRVIWYMGIVVVMGAATFVAFWVDKRRAVRSDRRIPERTLHALELVGGWAGAIAAMMLVRHKNRKASYWLVTALITAAHVGVVAWFMFR